MHLSLRKRVLLLTLALNALVFGVGGLFAYQLLEHAAERQREQLGLDLVHTLRHTIKPDREAHVASILQWPLWSAVEDAILVGAPLQVGIAGEISPRGAWLNPVGSYRRGRDFDEQRVLGAIHRAIEEQVVVREVSGGQALAIRGPLNEVWGGIWFRTSPGVDRGALALQFVGWFAVSTLVLTLGTFYALRKLVLDPVGALSEGSRRVREGDLTVRLAEPARRDELSLLVRDFNAMTAAFQGFNERLADEVEAATEQARKAEAAAMKERRLAAMGELAAGLAHEINNPLGGLLNAVETLERADVPPDKRRRYLGLLKDGLTRIGETVNRLRRFTPRAAPREPFDLALVAADAIALVRHRAERSSVVLELVPREAEPGFIAFGTKNEVGPAVLNLLVNALDALEEGRTTDACGPRVLVALGRRDGGVTIEVRDNGPGVAEAQLARVADLFYTTKEVGKGTGLGLALVHSAIAQQDGHVKIDSQEGRYFAVELWLPSPPAATGLP